MFWPKRPSFTSAEPTQTGFWARVADRIKVRPRSVWVTTSLLLAVACLGVFKLDTAGLATEDQYTKDMESIDGQLMLADHGLFDASNTVQVVAKADQAEAVRAAMTGIEGLGEPTEPATQDGVAFIEAPLAGDVAAQSTFDGDRAGARQGARRARMPTRWSADGRRSTSTPRSRRTATTW